MNALEFVNKVRELRQAQKQYFKTRLNGDLVKAKQLEAEVDKALAEGVTVRETHTLTDQDPLTVYTTEDIQGTLLADDDLQLDDLAE